MSLAPFARYSLPCLIVATAAAVALPTSYAGTAAAIGVETRGQFGSGITRQFATPLRLAENAAGIGASENRCFIIKTDGTLLAAGENRFYEFGFSTNEAVTTFTPMASNVREVFDDSASLSWITRNGELFGRGTNIENALGFPFKGYAQTQTRQIATGVVKSVSGINGIAYIDSAGTFWAQGYSIMGTNTRSSVAQMVKDIYGSVYGVVFINQEGTVCRLAYGTVTATEATGADRIIGLGYNKVLYRDTSGALVEHHIGSQYRVVLDTNVISAASSNTTTAWVKSDGSLWLMGDNATGIYGQGHFNPLYGAPMKVASNVKAVAVGTNTVIYQKTDGSVWGCGDNAGGQLGLGLPSAVYSRPYALRSGVASITTPRYAPRIHLVDTRGAHWVAGEGANGVLGTGRTTNENRFIKVQSNIAKVAKTAGSSTYSIDREGVLWGSGFLDLSTPFSGSTGIRSTFTQLMSGVTDVEVDYGIGFLLKNDGSLWRKYADFSPLEYIDENVRSVATTAATLYVKNDNTLWAVGNNLFGNLGTGDTTTLTVPKQVASGVLKVTQDVFGTRSAYLAVDGTLWAAGGYGYGLPGWQPMVFNKVATDVIDLAFVPGGLGYVTRDGTAYVRGQNVEYSPSGQVSFSDVQATPIHLADRVKGLGGTLNNTLLLLRDNAAANKDFNGDEMPDVIWHNSRTRQLAYIELESGSWKPTVGIDNLPENAEVVGVADFTNDDKADILTRTSNGAFNVWKVVAGKHTKEKTLAALPTPWRFAAISDFDNDGVPELVGRNSQTGAIAYFTQTQPSLPVIIPGSASGHQLVGVADFDRDLKGDLYYQTGTGQVFVRKIVNGAATADIPVMTLPTGYKVAGVADYNGDATPDLLTWDPSNGANFIEYLQDGKSLRRVRVGISKDWYPKN